MKKIILILFLIYQSTIAEDFSWQKGVAWQSEFEEMMALARHHNKPVFMFLDSRTCFYCPKLKKEIFSTQAFKEKLNKHFVAGILDNSVDADSDVPNTGQCPPHLTVSMTPAIYFMGPNEEKLARRGQKHMIIYGMWTLEQMLEWMDDAINRYDKLYGE